VAPSNVSFVADGSAKDMILSGALQQLRVMTLRHWITSFQLFETVTSVNMGAG
jgi:hypothetical protein